MPSANSETGLNAAYRRGEQWAVNQVVLSRLALCAHCGKLVPCHQRDAYRFCRACHRLFVTDSNR